MMNPSATVPSTIALRDISTWHFESSNIRQILIDGEPWFVGKDVATILGYADPQDALKKHVRDKDKLTRRFAGSGQNRQMIIINEAGLWSLMLRSKLPTAEKFQDWITSVVIPSIRKYGVYMTPDAQEKLLSDPVFILKIARENYARAKRVKELETEMATMTETTFHKLMRVAGQFNPDIDEPAHLTARRIAHLYGRDARWLNTVLEEKGVQHRECDGVWRLNDGIAHTGFRKDGKYRRYHTSKPIPTSYWTKTGLQFIVSLLHEYGIEPIKPIDEI